MAIFSNIYAKLILIKRLVLHPLNINKYFKQLQYDKNIVDTVEH
jgi:hypothetical protein